MKKILLGLGTFAAVAAPIAGVVSCGTASPEKLKTLFEEAGTDEGKREKALKKFHDATNPVSSLFGSEDEFAKKVNNNFDNVKTIADAIAALSTDDNKIEFLEIPAVKFKATDETAADKTVSANIMFIGPEKEDATVTVVDDVSNLGDDDFGEMLVESDSHKLADVLWKTTLKGAGDIAKVLKDNATKISHMLIATKRVVKNTKATTYTLTLVDVKKTYYTSADSGKASATSIGTPTQVTIKMGA